MDFRPIDWVLQAFPEDPKKILKKKEVFFNQLSLTSEKRDSSFFCTRFLKYYEQAKTPKEKLDSLVCLICSASEAVGKGAKIVSLVTEMVLKGDFRNPSPPKPQQRLQKLLDGLKIPIATHEVLTENPEEISPSIEALQAFEKLYCAWRSFLERVNESEKASESHKPFPALLLERNPYIPSSIALIETLANFYDQIGSFAQLTSLHYAFATSTGLEEFQACGPFSELTYLKPFDKWRYEFCLTGDFPPKIDQFLLKISFWTKNLFRDNPVENLAEIIFKKLPQFYDEPHSDEEKFDVIKRLAHWSGTSYDYLRDVGLKYAIKNLVKPTLSPFQKIVYLSENPPPYLRIGSFHKLMNGIFFEYIRDLTPKPLPQTEAEAQHLCKKYWEDLQSLVSELIPMLPEERPWIQRLMQDAQKLSDCIGGDIITVRSAYKRIFRRFSHFHKNKAIWAENLIARTNVWMRSLEQRNALHKNKQIVGETYWSNFCERTSMMRRCIKNKIWYGPRAYFVRISEAYNKLNQIESSIGPAEAGLWMDAFTYLDNHFFTDNIMGNDILNAFLRRHKAKHWVTIMEQFQHKGINYVLTLLKNYELLLVCFEREWLLMHEFERSQSRDDDSDAEFQYDLHRHERDHPNQINQKQLDLALKITNSKNPTILLDFLHKIPQHSPDISIDPGFIPQIFEDLESLAKAIERVVAGSRPISTLDFVCQLLNALPEVAERQFKILEHVLYPFLPILMLEIPANFFPKTPSVVTKFWINCFKNSRYREGLSIADNLTLNWNNHPPKLMRAISRYYSELKIARPKKVLNALLAWTNQSSNFDDRMEGAVAYLRCGGNKENLQDIIPELLAEWPKDIHKKKRLRLLSTLPNPIISNNDTSTIPYLMENLSAENLEKARQLVLTSDWDPKSPNLHSGRKPIKCRYDHFRTNPVPFMGNPRILMERIINSWVMLLWRELEAEIETKLTAFVESPNDYPKLSEFLDQLTDMDNTRWIPQQLMLPQGATVLRILTDRQGYALFEESVLSLLTTGCQKPDIIRIGKEIGAEWAKMGAIFATSNPTYAKSWFHDGASALVAIKGDFHNRQQIEGHVRHEYEGGFNHIYLNGVPKDAIHLIALPVSWQEDLQALFDKKKDHTFTVVSIKELSEKSRIELGRSLRETIDGLSFFERIQFYPPQSDWLGLIEKYQLQTITPDRLRTENTRWEIARNLVEERMPPGYFMLPDRALAEAPDSLFAELLPRTMSLMPKSLKSALSRPNNHGRTRAGKRHTIGEHTMEVITGNELAFGLYTDVEIKDWKPEEVRRVLRLAALLHDSGKKEGCDAAHVRRSSERAERLLMKCKHYLGIRKREIPVILALIEDNDRFGLYLQGLICKDEIFQRKEPPFNRNEWGRLLFTLFMADASTLKVVSAKRELYMSLRKQLNTLDFESMDWLESLL